MSACFRIVVAWLLALALPVQGLAATTMQHCGPNHAGHTTVAQAGHHAQHEQAHKHAYEHAYEHAHFSAAASTPVQPDVSVDQAVPTVAKAEVSRAPAGKCSACASCCSALALVAKPLWFPPPDPASNPFLPSETRQPGFFTDGQDRPPRPWLA